MYKFNIRIKRTKMIAIFIPFILLAVRPIQAANSTSFIVHVVPGTDVELLATDYQATVDAVLPALNLVRLQSENENFASEIALDERIISVELDKTMIGQPRVIGAFGSDMDAQPRVIGAFGDPTHDFATQWGVEKIRLAEAQQVAQGAEVIVAVLDTGILLDHELLAGKLVPGYDFVDDDADPSEVTDGLDQDGNGTVDQDAGHGTHVAGIVSLVAPEAKIMPIRIFNDEGEGSYFDAVAGIIYAVDNGAKVINLSGSGAEEAPFLADAIAYAQTKEVVVVAAGGVNSLGYPASYSSVISVGAADPADVLTDFSDFESMAHTVYAPGTSIFSAYHNGDYAWWTGNSMATPFVAGLSALMRSLEGCDVLCVQNIILTSAHPVVVDPSTQDLYGRIDAYDAVAQAAAQQNINLSIQARNGFDNMLDDQILKPFIQIENHGNSIPLHELSLRYWYTPDTAVSEIADCDYALIGCEHLAWTINDDGSDHYLEVGFAASSGMLFGGHNTGDMQLRVHKADWSNYDETDDYSLLTLQELTEISTITVYHNDSLVWGQEPQGASAPPPTNIQPPLEEPLPTDTVQATYHTIDADPMNNEAKPIIGLINNSSEVVALSSLTVRYWMNDQQLGSLQTHCDYASVGCDAILLTTTPTYVEVTFNPSAGELAPEAVVSDINLRFHHTDWRTFDETDDYSANNAINMATASDLITIYQNGQLIWGIEP